MKAEQELGKEGCRSIKVYFGGSVAGDRKFDSHMSELCSFLRFELGLLVTSKHVGYYDQAMRVRKLGFPVVYRLNSLFIDEAECGVFEGSSASTGSGREIERLLSQGKPVFYLVNHEASYNSAMIEGDTNPLLIVFHYSDTEEAKQFLKEKLENLASRI